MRSRRQWIHCLIIFRFIDAGRGQFGATHLQCVRGNEYDDDAEDNDAGECFVIVNRGNAMISCVAYFWRFICTVGAIIPAVAQKAGRNAHFVDWALEVLGAFTAIGLIVAVGAMRCAITYQTLVNAFAGLASKLFWSTRRTTDLIRFIGAIILAIAAPRHRDAVFVEIRHTATDCRQST